MMKNRGFTMTEVLIAAAIAGIILAALAGSTKDLLGYNRDALRKLDAELSGHKALKEMVFALRSAEFVEATSTDSISFDGERFFLDEEVATLLREADGEVSTVARGVENGSSTPVFEYDGRFVRVHLILDGRDFITGFTFRNL